MRHKLFKGYKEEVVKPTTQLPVGSYVVEITGAKEIDGDNGDRIDFHIDVAEGEYKGFFIKQYNENTFEDKKYKGNATLFFPKEDGSALDQKTKISFQNFMAYLAEENAGFHYSDDKDEKQFNGLKIGATFREEWNKDDTGREYSYTAFAWFCDPKDVRAGKALAAKPRFKNGATGKVYSTSSLPSGDNAGFINIDSSVEAEEIPFN